MNADSTLESKPPTKGDRIFYGCEIFLLTFASTATVYSRLAGTTLSVDLLASTGLLLFNYVIALAILARKEATSLGGPLAFGLILIGTKLFVNTLTLLLLIGLHAVQTPVFVPVFFVGYFVLLGSTVWALHRTNYGT